MATGQIKSFGRGMDALFGVPIAARAWAGEPTVLRLEQMVPGLHRPRPCTRMEEGALQALAESIKVQGIMPPILVRRLGPH